jgi:hypothetical protein
VLNDNREALLNALEYLDSLAISRWGRKASLRLEEALYYPLLIILKLIASKALSG